MQTSYSIPTPLDYFSTLVQSDEHFPLLEACASLAQDEYPELDVHQVLGDMDQLQARLQRRLAADAPPLHRLRMLNQFFYRELGFGGNVNNYYDPDNSYLNAVLRTRMGIPISLAVLWMELAQGLHLPVRGINFPGHFLVKVNLPKGQVVIDPFVGQSLSREELVERLAPYKQQQQAEHGEDFDVPLGLYLQSARPRDILARMLRNLKEIHRSQSDAQRLLAVQNRLVVLLPEAWSEYRDRGLTHADLGNNDEAVLDLEKYLVFAEEPRDTAVIADRVSALRRAQH